MPDHLAPFAAFQGDRLLALGPLHEVAAAAKQAAESDPTKPVLVFDGETGRPVDLDLRGALQEVVERLPAPPPAPPRGPGRPRLGVVAREVTLLPRHWDWLARQPGGASVALRKLVEEAIRAGGGDERRRRAQEAAYCFMTAMAGDLPGYEEACRTLFAADRDGFEGRTADWPPDVREHARRLAAL
ncbi:MAG TPA: DUF2239 family protein [Caulobacteraceae bacterium]|nr:DUF2239 family protein [Caulobacteraceae bacterium]